MKCFFSGKSNGKNKLVKGRGVISFAIPDYGVLFRSAYFGSSYECEYMGLLALLRFIETNFKSFANQKIEILTHSSLVVYQVNQNIFYNQNLHHHRKLALLYKKRLSYSLNWIPKCENKAENGIIEAPPMANSKDLNFDEFLEVFKNKNKKPSPLSKKTNFGF